MKIPAGFPTGIFYKTDMRLDKYLNDILNLGRKDLHRIIKAGRVTVNGEVQTSPDHKISEDSDVVCMDGENIMYRK